jgi:hypothetical protein
MGTKMGRLKSDALTAADSRGHDMTRFTHHELKNYTATSHCRNCHMSVTVNSAPAPNDIDIGGEAVALNCNITPMLGKATYCLKVVPSMQKPTFVYVDATSEEDAIKSIEDGNADSFIQHGVFFTDHMLHDMAKGEYLSRKTSK